MGRHSYFDVRVGSGPVACHSESPDMLVTFEPESLCRHLMTLNMPGYLIYSSDESEVELTRLGYLDSRLQDDLAGLLKAKGLSATTTGLLEMAHQRGIRTFAVPYKGLLGKLADELDLPRQRVATVINTLAVSVSAALLGLSSAYLVRALTKAFPEKITVQEMNQRAIEIAYRYVEDTFAPIELQLPPVTRRAGSEILLLNATQSVALGKLAAGLGFQTYYPISPATDESVYLEAHNTVPLKTGGTTGPLILQVEDELAAVTMASSAALTGARSATSTSGPGFSLMCEGLGWAGMNEVPLVITLYQRGGPSTGMPTRTDQGDLQFAIHGGHGEFPRLVLASGDIEECFYDAAQAFDYAERYQLPVIHLLDKALTSTLHTVPLFDVSRIKIERGELYRAERDPEKVLPRFALTETGISPRPLLGQAGTQHWITGVEHSEAGRVSEDPVVREKMMEKRNRKLK